MPWLFQFKGKSKVWWVGYRLHGKQFLRSTGYTDKAKAEDELHKINAMIAAQKARALTDEVYQSLTGRTVPAVTLKQALQDWVKETKASAGERTLEKYVRIKDCLIDYFKATDQGPLLRDIARDDLVQFMDARRHIVSASTVNMDRKCMTVFFRRCIARDLIRANPIDGTKPYKRSKTETNARRPFTLLEMVSIYKHAPDDFWRYLTLCGFMTGLRLGDLVTMPIGAFDEKEGEINLMSRKTQTPLHIPIGEPLLSMLRQLKSNREAEHQELFWPEQAKRYEESGSAWFSQRFYDLMLLKAGLVAKRPHRKGTKSKSDRRQGNEVSFHCFRHACVSMLARRNNQQTVKEIVGHSTDAINDLYTKVPKDVLRGAIAMLPDITKGAE